MTLPDKWPLCEHDRLLLVAGQNVRGKKLGTHWCVPYSNTGPTFMPVDTSCVLAEAKISVEQAERWFEKGWLSFSCREREALDQHHMAELVFVRSVAESLLSDTQVDAILGHLSKPYNYDCTRVAWSFMYGWVEMPIFYQKRNMDRIFEEHFDQWLRHLAVTGQRERIETLQDQIYDILEKLDEAEAAEEDEEDDDA